MMRGFLFCSCLLLTACSAAPQKSIPAFHRVAPFSYGADTALVGALRASAELVAVQDVGYGLLTRVTREDGRFPGISRARVNGKAATYQRIESRRHSGLAMERGLVVLALEQVRRAGSAGMTVSLCGVGTCYGIQIGPSAFDDL